ncbi:G-protein-coupled receptor family protein [Histomonas meleagridis]|uniref:G-protein-coupled receptor family protein n=1 Tax=Histomonas meleagridis TaxID=135588 RepID=UPI00355A1E89|nr:G-protein-coupled receptor family protein [Histomonas meleagridis]
MSSGQILHDTAPWPLFILALASFLQSILLIRYLQLRPATLVVVRMISSAIVTLLQFIVGCMPFFLGFVIFGVSWFGWYSPLMSSSRQVAKLLVAASYGDYLLDGYDGLTDGSDKPKIIPSAYLTVWIFNGLGIWFYIVLAILHAALFKEVHIARDEMIEEGEVNEEDMDAEDPLPWLQYVADR